MTTPGTSMPAKVLARRKRTSNVSPGKDKVWQSMRIMRAGFTVAELATVTEVHADTVEKYVRALLLAGFLRVTQAFVRGQAGSANRLRLVRDTGPLSPIRHQRGGAFDRNTGIDWGADGKPVVTRESSE